MIGETRLLFSETLDPPRKITGAEFAGTYVTRCGYQRSGTHSQSGD